MKHRVWIGAVLVAWATSASAQTPPALAAPERAFLAQQAQALQHLEWISVLDHAEQQIVTEKLHLVVPGKTVKSAPYSADTITESVQVLADGNRIVRRSTTRVYRDSEGRTRTEEVIGGGVQSVRISDPVSGETWTLDPQARTAYRSSLVVVKEAAGGDTSKTITIVSYGAGGERGAITVSRATGGAIQLDATQPPHTLSHVTITGGVVGSAIQIEQNPKLEGQATREDLGQQTIEGLVATGTRTTTTIPAGAIGNEQPIKIVSEQWFSPDLQVLVLTKFSDPRVGETTYRLTNVSRGTPDHSLFVVPPDYTIKEPAIKRQAR